MQYLERRHIGHQVYYTVYNSQGCIALVTSSHTLAVTMARSFEQYPSCTEVSVRELDPKRERRR